MFQCHLPPWLQKVILHDQKPSLTLIIICYRVLSDTLDNDCQMRLWRALHIISPRLVLSHWQVSIWLYIVCLFMFSGFASELITLFTIYKPAEEDKFMLFLSLSSQNILYCNNCIQNAVTAVTKLGTKEASVHPSLWCIYNSCTCSTNLRTLTILYTVYKRHSSQQLATDVYIDFVKTIPYTTPHNKFWNDIGMIFWLFCEEWNKVLWIILLDH